MEQPVIDWRRLLRLRDPRESAEPDVILELVASFASDTARRLARLHEAAAIGDVRTIAHEAHTLQGSAAALGADLMRAHAELLGRELKRAAGTDLTSPFATR